MVPAGRQTAGAPKWEPPLPKKGGGENWAILGGGGPLWAPAGPGRAAWIFKVHLAEPFEFLPRNLGAAVAARLLLLLLWLVWVLLSLGDRAIGWPQVRV